MEVNDPSLVSPPELIDFVKRVASELGPSHDRREHPRHHFTVAVEVQPLDDELNPSGEPFAAVTRDLSAVGIGLLHTRAVLVKFLQVTILAPGGLKRLTVEVLRCESIGRFYDIGGKFVLGATTTKTQ